MRPHVFIPTALASRHESAIHKLHNVLHAFQVDAGSWDLVKDICNHIYTVTTDRGAERLIESTPVTLDELDKLGFLPKLGVALEQQQQIQAPPSMEMLPREAGPRPLALWQPGFGFQTLDLSECGGDLPYAVGGA